MTECYVIVFGLNPSCLFYYRKSLDLPCLNPPPLAFISSMIVSDSDKWKEIKIYINPMLKQNIVIFAKCVVFEHLSAVFSEVSKVLSKYENVL